MIPARSPVRGARWRKRLRAAFTERLPLKATALFLAVVLWVITSTREEAEELLPVRFAPALDDANVLTGDPPEVRALVRGLGREVLKLHQTPPVIRRTIAGDLPDTVTIDLRAADVDLPPGVDARVLDLRPRTITLTFKPFVSKQVPVRSGFLITPDADGRVAAALDFTPDSVTVIGRRRGVARVRSLRTVADTLPALEGVTHVIRLDTAGLRALGVRARPDVVRVRVTRLAQAEDAFGEAEPERPAVVRRPAAVPPAAVPPVPVPPADSTRRDSTQPPAARDTSVPAPAAPARDTAPHRRRP
ncbi:MAG TPA: hypothetical protein VEA99_12785 [Gemmatimonadaceae bacterium]|nr:hypothetical protein [Gemmatimonadaceae bacterium]